MAVDLSKLTGNVRTVRPNGTQPYGVPWSNVTRYANEFQTASRERNVPSLLLAAMAMVESDSTHYAANGQVIVRQSDGYDAHPTVGIMQVKPVYWQYLEPNADAYTPQGNILLGAAVMGWAIARHGTWQKALTEVYFPGPDSGSGTTQNAYVQTVTSLMAEIENNIKPVAGGGNPTPAPVDPIAVIVGGPYPPVDYGWLSDIGLNYYPYGVGHGTTRRSQHTGIDVSVPDETTLYAPMAGKVLCVGTNGTNLWGNGCGSYTDTGTGSPNAPIQGVGNITILLDGGLRLTMGHCSASYVGVGQRVTAGMPVGRSGGQNGYHVHIETAIYAPDRVNRAIQINGGDYFLLEPVSALRQEIGGVTQAPQPTYAARAPVPQPAEFEGSWTVTVVAPEGLAVRQRANMTAPEVAARLTKGEQFSAVYLAYGQDGKPWWISKAGGRVTMMGTECEAVVPQKECPDLFPAYWEMLEEVRRRSVLIEGHADKTRVSAIDAEYEAESLRLYIDGLGGGK
jgi:murein DD-endopeptidase MepM/ murein hydrolase activator NlpD